MTKGTLPGLRYIAYAPLVLWAVSCSPAAVARDGSTDVGGGDIGTDATMTVDATMAVDVATDRRTAPDVQCTNCLGTFVQWGFEGGFDVGFDTRDRIDVCRTFTRVTYSFNGRDASAGCTHEIAACGADAGFDVGALERMLADPDVVDALAAGFLIYGRDNRSSDGAIFNVATDAGAFEVGEPCQLGTFNCNHEIPPGVAALQSFLRALSSHETIVCDAGP